MKAFIAMACLVASVAYVCGTANSQKFKTEIGDCMKEMNLTIDDLQKMMANNDPQYGCFEACVMKKLGVMENDKILKEKTIEVVMRQLVGLGDRAKVEARVNRCADQSNTNTDYCVVAHTFQQCVVSPDEKVCTKG